VLAASVVDISRSQSVFVTLNPPPGSFVPVRPYEGSLAERRTRIARQGLEYRIRLDVQHWRTAMSGVLVSGTTIPVVYQGVRYGDAT
jgi:hypothetical protein